MVVYWPTPILPAISTTLPLPGTVAGVVFAVVSCQLAAVVQLPPLAPVQL